VGRTARIADLGPQPGLGVLQQGNGAPPTLGWRTGGRIIGGQKLHQGCRHLFGGPPGALALEGVPVPVADAELAMQAFGQGQGLGGPRSMRRH
jgi:hypothetical protein